MFGRTLLKTYTTLVYSDGSIEIKELKDYNRTYDCPDSLMQLLLIIENAIDYYSCTEKSDSDLKCAITFAIKTVASELNLTVSTVQSKITRWLGVNMNEFRELISDYYQVIVFFDNDIPELYSLLQKNINKKCKNSHQLTESIALLNDVHDKIKKTCD